MIRVNAVGFGQFYAAHAILRAAGVEVTASGGNEMRVPDDTRLDVLRAVAGTGATVYADLTNAAAEPAVDAGGQPIQQLTYPDGVTAEEVLHDLTPSPGPQLGSEPEAPEADTPPARKPRKTTTRRTSTKE